MPAGDMHIEQGPETPKNFFRAENRQSLSSVVTGEFAEAYSVWVGHRAGRSEVEEKLDRASGMGLDNVVGQSIGDIVDDLPREMRQNKAVLAASVAKRADQVEKAVQAAIQAKIDAKQATPDDLVSLEGFGAVEAIRNAALLAASSGFKDDKEVQQNAKPLTWGKPGQERTETRVLWDNIVQAADAVDELRAAVGLDGGDSSQVPKRVNEILGPALVVGATAVAVGSVREAVGKIADRLGFKRQSAQPTSPPEFSRTSANEAIPTAPVVEGKEKQAKMTWKKSQDILDTYAEKVAKGRPVSAAEHEDAAGAASERDRMVAEAKATGILDQDMKDRVKKIIDDIVSDYVANVNTGRNMRNPRELLSAEIEELLRVKGEPEGDLAGIRRSWYDGILRNVDQRDLQEEIVLRQTLKMPEHPSTRENLRVATKRIENLNWGNIKPETEERLSIFGQISAHWMSEFGPNKNQYALASQALNAAGGGAGPDWKEIFGSGAKYEDFIRRVLNQDGAHTNWTDFPPAWYKNLPDDLKSQAEFYELLANGASVKKRVGQIKLDAVLGNEALPAIDKRDVKAFYESAGGREALEAIMNKYFEPEIDKYGNYFVRLKGYRSSLVGSKIDFEETKIAITNADAIDAAKKEIWLGLRSDPRIIQEAADMRLFDPNEQDLAAIEAAAVIVAKGKVANAWNFIFNSHVVESADVDRNLAPGSPSYVEQVRANFHPLAKMKVKMGLRKEDLAEAGSSSEAWGGAVGAWLAENAANPKIRQEMLNNEIRPFPKTMFASMLEIVGWEEPATDTSPKAHFVSMAQALMSKTEITEERWALIKPQELIGSYADAWSAAAKVYAYATGDDKVVIKQLAQVRGWGVELANALAKLRGLDGVNLMPYIDDAEALLWMAANSLPVDSKKYPLTIVKGGQFRNLDIVLNGMFNERLMNVADPITGKPHSDTRVLKRIKNGLGATLARSFF